MKPSTALFQISSSLLAFAVFRRAWRWPLAVAAAVVVPLLTIEFVFLGANLANITVRQNDDMRTISAWVAIAAIPTMIGGIYGMNFEHMPELNQRWAYPVVLATMVVLCLIVHRRFKRAGWL